MKALVLGSNGMLGRYVSKYLSTVGFQVATLNRDKFDIYLDAFDVNPYFMNALTKCDFVVNCAGVIKPRMAERGIMEGIFVNSFFPHALAKDCQDQKKNLIHVTTDCVYSGKMGGYVETDSHDPIDDYGKSKSLGEPMNCTLIRTSIVGEEVEQSRSLLNWVLSQKGKTVNGYSNHSWNGVTCLQFAKIVETIANNNLWWKGLRHIHSPDFLSKRDMLEVFSKIYDLNLDVKAETTIPGVNRCLKTMYQEVLDSLRIPPLRIQIAEMKEWSEINL